MIDNQDSYFAQDSKKDASKDNVISSSNFALKISIFQKH